MKEPPSDAGGVSYPCRVTLCEDGTYRWTYELNMFRSPVIFWMVFKIFAIIWFFIWLFIALLSGFDDLAGLLRLFLYMLALFAGLTLLGYLLVAAIYGGRYVVRFEMDEKEVRHIQEPLQARKARKLGLFTMLAGLLSRNPTTAGAGMLSASRSSSTSVLENVRSVRGYRRLHLIKVNQRLARNQVYVPDEDFDFVYDFLKTHCPNAR